MAQVTVTSLGPPYNMRVHTTSHEWSADEPVISGGGNQGPSPFELLLSSVGACSAITAQMYAQRKQWPLTGVRIELEYRRLSAEEIPDGRAEKGRVSEIVMQTSFKGPLSDQQIGRLLEISVRCPVKRALEGAFKIRTRRG